MFKILKCNKGLTLIEVMVSLAILGIIVVPLSSLFVNTIKTNKQSEDQLIANQLAQQYMEVVKFNETTEVTKPNGTNDYGEFIGTESGDFRIYKKVEENKDYSIEKKSSPSLDYHGEINIEKDKDDESKDIFTFKDANKSVSEEIRKDKEYEAKLKIEKISNTRVVIYFNDNLKYTNEKGIYKEITNIDLTKDNLNIKINCSGNKSIKLYVDSLENIKTNIYIVKSKDSKNEINIESERGIISVYKNIFDKTVEKEENSWLYKVIITVVKKEKPVVQLVGFKKID